MRTLVAGIVAALVACPGWAAPSSPHAGRSAPPPARRLALELDRRLDAADVRVVHSNAGWLAYRAAAGNPGFFYPRGQTRTVCYAAGLWLGARVAGEPRVAVAEYESEFQPGALAAPGAPADPASPRFRAWKVRAWTGDPADTAHVDLTPAEIAADPTADPLAHHSWSEYLVDAAPFGAPVRTWRLPDESTPAPGDSIDVPGPDVPGTQMTWALFNDGNPLLHTATPGATAPLNVEVQQSVVGFTGVAATLGRTVFVRWRIFNRSGATLDSLRVGLWADPDLGAPDDDLVACDTLDALGYAYNATTTDAFYPGAAPAFGWTFLGDAGGSRATAFRRYTNGADPTGAQQTLFMLDGLDAAGNPLANPHSGQHTPFEVSGDPVNGAGWLDVFPADRRFMLVQRQGPIAPGAFVDVWGAFVVGQGADRLSSITDLRCAARTARAVWASGFATLDPAVACSGPVDCPRRPEYWQTQCEGGDYLSPVLHQLADRVQAQSTLFAWSLPLSSFCAEIASTGDARNRARREYAALLANVLAAQANLQPEIGARVRLSDQLPVSCAGSSATTLQAFLAPAPEGPPRVHDARYLDLDPMHTGSGLVGVAAGLEAFEGGAGTARGFLGSSLDPATQPDSFHTVRMTFDRQHPRRAHRYLRREMAGGGAPAPGRGYLYAGYVPTFVTAVDSVTGDTLALGFVERVVTAEDGTILPGDQQPATFDSTWTPDDSVLGGREYLLMLRHPDHGAEQPLLAVDGAVANAALPWLYALWARLASPDPATIDDGDGFVIRFGVPRGDGADSRLIALESRSLAEPSVVAEYEALAECMAAFNRGDRSPLVCDAPTAVLAALVSATARPGVVELEWSVASSDPVDLERCAEGDVWTRLATLSPDGSGRVTYDDRSVRIGARYHYRLRLGIVTAGEVAIEVPSVFRLQLTGTRPNPAGRDAVLMFSIPTREAARIELMDVAGRRVWSHTMLDPEPGDHVIALGTARLSPGIYLVRLTQGRGQAVTKAVLAR